ncbi:helix-turn-helix domain-containing protein [Goodfellowiella coeruleoviolacea]|uniref:PucR C-terminal helix-turn-helix domain-containing protein n=1 Tax=Goodfellowiella coeruleoviolacea TaxID=334858 RepID=A0AAE3GJ77_9PSEU|nr:helix-turn-helix domain-containing protein [Goodfellowiella coeruleoviolacea]MCP2169211.1 PucR C-terminal helix-turn-helix domain-containing protein [Goodfellowiella coeruleoviolacea]
MQSLAARIAALDPSAEAAMQVIAYFDELTQRHAGLEPVVRGAATLTGVAARLVDPVRRVRMRVTADGRRQDSDAPPEPTWLSAPVFADQPATIWLETQPRGSLIDDLVLQRAALTAGVVLTLVRGQQPTTRVGIECALTETVLDPHATVDNRLTAARQLGLAPDASARVFALPRGGATIAPPDRAVPAEGRVGVGPATPVLRLPESAARARTALRFTAEGTEHDPGPRVVHAEELGGLELLAQALGPDTPRPPDLDTLLRASAEAPWMLATLTVFAEAASLRGAASRLFIHHSTLQQRIEHAERVLGWPLREPAGQLRLALALAMRLLARPEV